MGQQNTQPVMPPAGRRQSRMIEPALTDSQVDASAVYRCLRWLEGHDQVRSEWDTSDEGAPKRRYELTELGVKALSLWADLLRRRQGALHKYMVRYREGVARYRKRRKI